MKFSILEASSACSPILVSGDSQTEDINCYRWLHRSLFAFILLSLLFSPVVHSSTTSTLFEAVGKSAANEVGGAAAGWVLGALGLTSGNDSSEIVKQLSEVNSDLVEIENTLKDIDAELVNIQDAIDQLNCDAVSSNTNDARALIDSLASDYMSFVETSSGNGPDGNPPALPPTACTTEQKDPSDCLENWANAVLDDATETSGILNAVNQINQALITVGSAQGVIAACLDSSVLPPPTAGEFDDTKYYDQVANLINFYYSYQTRGLLLLVEAYHFKAWLNAGQPAGQPGSVPDATTDICTLATKGSVITNCNNAIVDTNSVYSNLQEQFELGGAPYTNTNTLLQYDADVGVSNASATLFVRSLEAFTEVAGNDCSSPLTSADPCGVTAGMAYMGFSKQVMFSGYTEWIPANAAQLATALDAQNSSQTPADYLNSIGFQNMADKIVLTPSTAEANIGQVGSILEPVNPNVMFCFMDTGILKSFSSQPFCSNDAAVNRLVTKTGTMVAECGSTPFTFDILGTHPSLPENRNQFYDLRVVPFSGDPCRNEFELAPGWWPPANGEQYRWPVIAVENLKCTSSRSPTNPGGAFTLCGSDFDAWFNVQVPIAPTATISQTLNAADFQSSDTLSVNVSIKNNVPLYDFYLGGILPDGNTMFFVTALNPLTLAEGFLDDPATFHPLKLSTDVIPLGVKVYLINLLAYTFIGTEPIGNHQIFSAITWAGAFSDGSMDDQDIIALDLDTITFGGLED